MADELSELESERQALYEESDAVRKRILDLTDRISAIKNDDFDRRKAAGEFDELTPETFTVMRDAVRGTSNNAYSWMKEKLAEIDPHIYFDGSYVVDTNQQVFGIHFARGEIVSQALVEKVLFVSRLVQVDDHPVVWHILEHSLGASGSPYLEVWPDQRKGKMWRQHWGSPMSVGGKRSLKSALQETAGSFWYDAEVDSSTEW